jgi:hypothetical protein
LHCSIVSRTNPDEGCTVDLVTSDEKDEFEFLAVMEPKKGKTLADCFTDSDLDNTFVRLPLNFQLNIPLPHRMQFNYGKTNEELEQFEKTPIDAKECPKKEECESNGGKCMDSTSLEISWWIDGGNYYFVLLPRK